MTKPEVLVFTQSPSLWDLRESRLYGLFRSLNSGMLGNYMGIRMPIKYCIALLFIINSAASAQQSPYFPRSGAGAIAQAVREIGNPSAYLVIAAGPGFEDLASIANFRIGGGANVAVAYVTNGEDIPSDFNGEMFYQLASRRKEEAYHALSYLGAQAFFLNIPSSDFSAGSNCFHPTVGLTAALNRRLDSLIIQTKPDVIVLDRDPLSPGKESARLAFLEHLIIAGLHNPTKAALWNVKRLFVQTKKNKNSVVIPVEQRDTVWSKSYGEMAQEAERSYASLRYQIPLWKEGGQHSFVQRYPAGMKSPIPLHRDLPEIGAQLKTLLPAISSIRSIDKVSDREQQLEVLRGVIAQIDAFIHRYEQSMTPTDVRVLSEWKLELEKLRCQIIGVTIPYNVSDTVVTPIQVFFLRFGKLDSIVRKGKTQVLFPGVIEKQWIVNETQNSFYDIKDSTQFRVLSPRSIALNSTETPQGFGSMQVRTPLVFIVYHEDPDPNHNFMFREEIPLIIAPFRSAEVLSPQVMMYRDTTVRIRLKSNVHDKTKGVIYIDDAIVSSPQKQVDMQGKNVVVLDTLSLTWKDTLLTAPREVKIWARKGVPVGSFIVLPPGVKVNNKTRVAVCSAVENSPVQIALRRLDIAPTLLDSTNFSDRQLLNNSVIIVDQFSFGKFLGLGRQLDSVGQWINKGGRLIILSQFGTERLNPYLGNDIAFTPLSVGDCKEKLFIDSSDRVYRVPNYIRVDGFTRESFAISFSEITDRKSDNTKILMKEGNRVLLLRKRVGHGTIYYCAMSLFPRLLDFHTPSYELLANLLSTGLEQ
jgi:hypothetical protein